MKLFKCCQTGELHTVNSENLLTEQIEPANLTPGASLMMEQDNKKIYPVTYVKGWCVCGCMCAYAGACMCVCAYMYCTHACVCECMHIRNIPAILAFEIALFYILPSVLLRIYNISPLNWYYWWEIIEWYWESTSIVISQLFLIKFPHDYAQNLPVITNASSNINVAQDVLWKQPILSTSTIDTQVHFLNKFITFKDHICDWIYENRL